jgi:hypothetical protein
VILTISSGEEESGVVGLSSPLDPGQYETLNPALNIIVMVADTTAPRVTDVKLSSTLWTQAYKDLIDVDTTVAGTGVGFSVPNGANQTKPWQWANVNQVIVEFNEDVRGSGPGGTLIPADFVTLGVNQLAYPIASVSYNPVTFRATLNFASPLPLDKYRLGANDIQIRDLAGNRLDGEWVDNVTIGASGNGVFGGIFAFSFNIAPGNFDGSFDGLVGLFDMGLLGMGFGSTIGGGPYNKFTDADGDGIIGLFDMGVMGLAFGKMLPAGSPGSPGWLPGSTGGLDFAEGEGIMASAVDQLLGAEGESGDDDPSWETQPLVDSVFDDWGAD